MAEFIRYAAHEGASTVLQTPFTYCWQLIESMNLYFVINGANQFSLDEPNISGAFF